MQVGAVSRTLSQQHASHSRGAGGKDGRSMGRAGGQELSVRSTPRAEMTPRQSRSPAHVACCDGSLTLPGPQSWKMTTDVASCLPRPFRQQGTHFFPQLLTSSLFVPGTQNSSAKGVFLLGHQILNNLQITDLQPSPSPLPSLLPKILPENEPIWLGDFRVHGVKLEFSDHPEKHASLPTPVLA